jgi:ketosteroid isomerase-like protein
MNNADTVRAIYEAFGRGDVAAILDRLDDLRSATHYGRNYSFPLSGNLWQLNAAGEVVKYDHVTDTAQMIRMARGE